MDDGIECDDDVYIDGPSPQFIHHHVNSFHHHDTRIISSSPNIHNRHGRHDDGSASENEYDIPDSISQR